MILTVAVYILFTVFCSVLALPVSSCELIPFSAPTQISANWRLLTMKQTDYPGAENWLDFIMGNTDKLVSYSSVPWWQPCLVDIILISTWGGLWLVSSPMVRILITGCCFDISLLQTCTQHFLLALRLAQPVKYSTAYCTFTDYTGGLCLVSKHKSTLSLQCADVRKKIPLLTCSIVSEQYLRECESTVYAAKSKTFNCLPQVTN